MKKEVIKQAGLANRLKRPATKGFFKLCLATLVAVYFLIAVGGIVRATGSGMGCPDWPKCFGQWIPPTSVNQLPKQYKESYASFRERKNQKFIHYLKTLGFSQTADKIAADKTILIEADFNGIKTWIEYINRLIGVVIGLLILILFWLSFQFIKKKPAIFWLALTTLVAVIFQGWFGSLVVSSNLTTWTVTVHLFIALVIIGILTYLLFLSYPHLESIQAPRSVTWIVVACILVLLTQIFLGTQVREAIDRLVFLPRDSWISTLKLEFIIHRSFSWLVVGLHILLRWSLQKNSAGKTLSRILLVLILISFLTGAGMAYLNVPVVLQPLHLLLATVCFGLQLFLLFRLNSSKNAVLTS